MYAVSKYKSIFDKYIFLMAIYFFVFQRHFSNGLIHGYCRLLKKGNPLAQAYFP
jgi:hypothetical protein